jgi:uncharacterized protein
LINLLKNTFTHIPGIGRNTEIELWENDILTWEEFLEKKENLNLSETKIQRITNHLNKSIEAFNNKNLTHFINLPNNMHWRVYPHAKVCFLDIETTGLDKNHDEVTLIGLFNGKESKIFINGKNLHEFENEIKKYDLLVTFNGRCFDIPFLRHKFPNANLEKMHVDLRFAMKELGYSGGLKRIEKELGIIRSEDLQEVDGFEAVRLWYKYKKGDLQALKTLLKYNQADIENLKFLMDFTFNKLKERDFLSYI